MIPFTRNMELIAFAFAESTSDVTGSIHAM